MRTSLTKSAPYATIGNIPNNPQDREKTHSFIETSDGARELNVPRFIGEQGWGSSERREKRTNQASNFFTVLSVIGMNR